MDFILNIHFVLNKLLERHFMFLDEISEISENRLMCPIRDSHVPLPLYSYIHSLVFKTLDFHLSTSSNVLGNTSKVRRNLYNLHFFFPTTKPKFTVCPIYDV